MRIIDVSEVGRVLYEWRKHSHIYWEIIVVLYGEAVCLTDFGEFCIKAGEIMIIPPDINHSFVSENGYKDRSFYIDEMNLDFKNVKIIKGEDRNFIELSERLFNAYLKEKSGNFSSLEEKSKFFLRYILNVITTEENLPFIVKVRNFIDTNFSNCMLNEKLLAERFGYNENYLRRRFKEEYGLTPLQYLSEVRISKAKNLLRFARKFSVGEISHQVGFVDQLYFSRFFKKHTGFSPSEYRDKF